jgi:hypothetical protein
MGLGSGIPDPEKTFSGSRGQKDSGSRIQICNTGKKLCFSRASCATRWRWRAAWTWYTSGASQLWTRTRPAGPSAPFFKPERALFGRCAPPLYFTRFYLETFSIMGRLWRLVLMYFNTQHANVKFSFDSFWLLDTFCLLAHFFNIWCWQFFSTSICIREENVSEEIYRSVIHVIPWKVPIIKYSFDWPLENLREDKFYSIVKNLWYLNIF